jgi:SNF2-related domain/Helicase conserved C-terminal domain
MLPNLDESRFKTKPYKHQSKCLELHGHKPAFFLSAEMGTGKSWILINNMADLWSAGELDSVIVFAPNGVHTNWTLIELPKHMPDWVDWKAAAYKSGMGKGATKKFEDIFTSSNGKRQLRILTMNWEGLNHKSSFEILERFVLIAGKLMIVGDEPSGYIKNPSSIRFKQLLKLKYRTTFRRFADGTPVTQGPFDAFAPYNFLDKRILETDSYFAFKTEYAEMIPDTVSGYDDNGKLVQKVNPLLQSIMDRTKSKRIPQVVQKGAGGMPKYKNLDKLQKLIAPHTFRVLKKDCLDLPEKIYKTAFFELTAQQKVHYEKALKECRLVYEGEETPVAKLVSITKLAQITSGYYIHPEHEEPVRIAGENPKLDLMRERVCAIARQGSKVIVWARYHVQIEDIVAALEAEGVSCVQYHGRVKMVDREAAKIAFQEGEAQVMVAQQQAGGTGVTWTAADYTLYFSNTFSLRDRLQSEDRNHRIGQTRNVTYIDIVASETVDEQIVRALLAKKNIADIINGDGRELLSA